MYVGVNTTFERQFYLPPNGINLKDDSHVISLSTSALLGADISYRYAGAISKVRKVLLFVWDLIKNRTRYRSKLNPLILGTH